MIKGVRCRLWLVGLTVLSIALCVSPVLADPDCTVTVAATVCASSINNTASVPDNSIGVSPTIPYTTYEWAITNGSITDGQGTNEINWTAGSVGTANIHVVVSDRTTETSMVACQSFTDVEVTDENCPIPTLSEWGAIILMLLLSGLALLTVRRKHKQDY